MSSLDSTLGVFVPADATEDLALMTYADFKKKMGCNLDAVILGTGQPEHGLLWTAFGDDVGLLKQLPANARVTARYPYASSYDLYGDFLLLAESPDGEGMVDLTLAKAKKFLGIA